MFPCDSVQNCQAIEKAVLHWLCLKSLNNFGFPMPMWRSKGLQCFDELSQYVSQIQVVFHCLFPCRRRLSIFGGLIESPCGPCFNECLFRGIFKRFSFCVKWARNACGTAGQISLSPYGLVSPQGCCGAGLLRAFGPRYPAARFPFSQGYSSNPSQCFCRGHVRDHQTLQSTP